MKTSYAQAIRRCRQEAFSILTNNDATDSLKVLAWRFLKKWWTA
jgi:hypothetical protein